MKDRKIKNIDILTLKPYYVSTALINFRKGLFIIEPEELVQSTWTYVLAGFISLGREGNQRDPELEAQPAAVVND